MDPITLMAIGALVTSVLVIVMLNWTKIVDWFRQRQGKITDLEKKRLAVTIRESLESGNVEVIQGIFDTTSETLVEGVKYKAKDIDADTKRNLSGSPVKIYN